MSERTTFSKRNSWRWWGLVSSNADVVSDGIQTFRRISAFNSVFLLVALQLSLEINTESVDFSFSKSFTPESSILLAEEDTRSIVNRLFSVSFDNNIGLFFVSIHTSLNINLELITSIRLFVNKDLPYKPLTVKLSSCTWYLTISAKQCNGVRLSLADSINPPTSSFLRFLCLFGTGCPVSSSLKLSEKNGAINFSCRAVNSAKWETGPYLLANIDTSSKQQTELLMIADSISCGLWSTIFFWMQSFSAYS